ncbi:hypothetical protein F0L68_30480 [Solihabitans fulvus]|uniref:Uncharacterized protein n=1 Tax=Solihabitans fulvus TaxID=1892852 RepID=A0A5B2WU25_9PSEU|nr:hypothetical protein [Solihabitans fulvus]KAA2254508.1 hypothetical protein F0L68_30480 [Solihabitans fulvus]
MPDPDGPHSQFNVNLGLDALSGQFNFQFQYTLADLRLEHLEGTLGELDILSDPAFQLQFPTSPGPVQAGLMVNFLHWKLPQLGPVIASVAVQGATNYLDTQGWQLAPSLNGDIRLAQAKWLVLSGSGGCNVNFFGGGARVEPSAQVTIGVEFVLDPQHILRLQNH